MKISVVIPTRGDVDMSNILAHLKTYPEVVDIQTPVGNTPFNRYRAMAQSQQDIVFTQDDDCITDIRPLIEAYDPEVIVNAMTPQHAAQYVGRQTLIGFGAIFHRHLLSCFERYPWLRDELFYRESDRIFPTVNPHKTVFPKIDILPQAHAPNRLWKQPYHNSARMEMNGRIFDMTGIQA